MFKKLTSLVTVCVLIGLILLTSGTAQANWLETFGGNDFDLATWQFSCYPDLTKTFTNRPKRFVHIVAIMISQMNLLQKNR